MKDYGPGTKRAKRRVGSKLDVMCRQIIDGKVLEFRCVSTDVSETGIRIEAGRALDPSKSLFLEIRLPHPENVVISAISSIKWRKEDLRGKDNAKVYAYGINFEEIEPKALDSLFRYIYPIGKPDNS